MPSPSYRVQEIYPSIQGEGALTGVPMVIVRLQGCDVGCPWCDTKPSWNFDAGEAMSTGDILDRVAEVSSGHKWILITGGEPALQPLADLISAARGRGFQTAIETSGTALGMIGAGADWVCISPKEGMPGGKRVLPEAVSVADELKFIVGRAEDIAKIEDFLRRFSVPGKAIVSVQPLSLNPSATRLCTEAAQQKGWRLSLQTHKLLGLP